jgi:WD40 repeat protein/predicted Ser/Thr protein kinase
MITVPDQAAGQWGSCPYCRASVQAPSITPLASPPPTAPDLAKSSSSLPTRVASGRQPPPGGLAPSSVSTPGDPAIAKEVSAARADPRKQFGRFTILNELGKGGMGVVYRAWDEKLARTVAIKMLLADDASADLIKRFEREAATVAKLHHPNIVAVHEVGENEGKRYLVMDFIDGAMLEKRVKGKNKLPLTKAIEVMRDVCRAVHYAHEQGVIHRDLKPANVMLDKKDHAFVMDFGLARVRGQKTRLTRSGAGLGTPAYMPPEQAEAGESDVDERADVYSLGATLYHVLTGRPPFEGPTEVNVIHALLTRDPDPPSKINPRAAGDLETITLRCLEKDKEKRYASAEALAQELDRYLAGDPIEARPLGPVSRAIRRVKRQKVVSGLIAAVFVAVVVGLGAWLNKAREASAHAEELKQKEEETRRAEAEMKEAEAKKAQAEAAKAKAEAAEATAEAERIKADAATAEERGKKELAQRLLTTARAVQLAEEALAEGKYGQAAALAAWAHESGEAIPGARDHPDRETHHLLLRAKVAWVIARQGPWRKPAWLGGVNASSLAWLSDGRLLVGAQDGNVIVLDAAAMRGVAKLPGHVPYSPNTGPIAVAVSPRGDRIATGSEGTVRIWDAASGSLIATTGRRPQDDNSIIHLAWSEDGKLVASGTGNPFDGNEGKTLATWDAATGKAISGPIEAHGNDDQPFGVDGLFLVRLRQPNAAYALFTVGSNQMVELFDAADLARPQTHFVHSHLDEIFGTARRPSSDGHLWFATAGRDRSVKLWKDDAVWLAFLEHEDVVWDVAWSADGRRLGSASTDRTVRLLDFADMRPIARLECGAPARAVAFDPGGTWIAASTFDHRVLVWNQSPGFEVVERIAHSPSLYVSIAWSPDGEMLASASESDRFLKIWDATGAEKGRIAWETDKETGPIYSVDWSPDGRRVAAAAWNPGGLRAWDVSDPSRPRQVLESKDGTYKSHMTWSSSDRIAINADKGADGKNLAILDGAGHRERTINFPGGYSSAAWSPDGKKLAVLTAGALALVDPKGEGRTAIQGEQPFLHVAWSPDGTRLAVVEKDGTVTLRDVTGGGKPEELGTVPEGTASSVDWSPDGKWIAVGRGDGKITLWCLDPKLPAIVLRPLGHSPIVSLQFRPRGGTSIATSHADGSIRLWALYKMLEAKPSSAMALEEAGWEIDKDTLAPRKR